MSARNKPEAKAERREERAENVREQGFKASVQFAFQAAKSTQMVPIEVLEDALAYGEALLVPGVSLDDALEVEGALRALRGLIVYRKVLEGAPQTFEVAAVGETSKGAQSVVLNGPDLGAVEVGQRVLLTITREAPEES